MAMFLPHLVNKFHGYYYANNGKGVVTVAKIVVRWDKALRPTKERNGPC